MSCSLTSFQMVISVWKKTRAEIFHILKEVFRFELRITVEVRDNEMRCENIHFWENDTAVKRNLQSVSSSKIIRGAN